jgi:DNA-directed RNA polymerase subunit K/omega
MSEAPISRFEYVTIAAARAKQLLDGCTPKIEGSAKPGRRAMQEVTAGAVRRVEPETEER